MYRTSLCKKYKAVYKKDINCVETIIIEIESKEKYIFPSSMQEFESTKNIISQISGHAPEYCKNYFKFCTFYFGKTFAIFRS